jgi:hypothetical protein
MDARLRYILVLKGNAKVMKEDKKKGGREGGREGGGGEIER